MTREEAKKLLPIIKAFSDGKTIQHLDIINDKWEDVDEFVYHGSVKCYRIKPEPAYRPFANAEECWAEMLKHESFGWVKSTLFKDLALVQRVTTLYVEINRDIIDYKDTLEKFTFADGTPFGVKAKED